MLLSYVIHFVSGTKVGDDVRDAVFRGARFTPQAQTTVQLKEETSVRFDEDPRNVLAVGRSLVCQCHLQEQGLDIFHPQCQPMTGTTHLPPKGYMDSGIQKP
jgi:hypothetical protein